jgi:hypothetical protein
VAVYPDYVSDLTPADRMVWPQMQRFLKDLLENDVEVVDLHAAFRDYRLATNDRAPLFYAKDRHWRNLGAQVAAEAVAGRLRRYDFVQAALSAGNPYTTETFHRNPGEAKEDDVLLIKRGGAAYEEDPRSKVIVTADSYGMYNMHLKSDISAQVARHIGLPTTFLCSEGLWAGMPVELARRDRESRYLDGRRAIVWTMIGRAITYGNQNWAKVPLAAGSPGAAAAN